MSVPEPFSVTQFFANGEYETVRKHVPLEDAGKAFGHYTTSVGASMGMTNRVIMTDAGDSIVAEWTFEDGITFPPEWVEAALKIGRKATRKT